MPFDGYNPKQLNRRFRSKKNDICKDKDSQSKFLKDVTRCVKDLLEKKTVGNLDPDETAMLDATLHHLRMSFLELSNAEKA